MLPGGRCSQLPERAYSDMGAEDGIITVMERHRPPGDKPYPKRPARFRFHPSSFECLPRDLDGEVYVFSDEGRNFNAFAAIGEDGSISQMLAILDSFQARRR